MKLKNALEIDVLSELEGSWRSIGGGCALRVRDLPLNLQRPKHCGAAGSMVGGT